MSARSDFVPLHVHGTRSLLDGLAKPSAMAEKLVVDGAVACAITDHGTLAGTFAHYKAMTKVGIKPILGLEAYLAIGSRHDKDSVLVPAENDMDGGESGEGGTKRKNYEHLTMLAATREGWRNLVAGHNESWEHVYYKPRWDFESMAQYSKGIIVGTGCLGGPVAGPLLRDDYATAQKNLATLVDIYGRDGVFVEIMNHGIAAELKVIPALVKLADEFQLLVVATNDSHYTSDCDADAHDAWLTIGSSKGSTTKLVSDTDRFRFNGSGYHMRTAAEMHALFDDQPGTGAAVANSLLIAERVDADVLPVPADGEYRLPKFELPADFRPDPAKASTPTAQYLHNELLAGAKRRYGSPLPEQVKSDLRWEEDVITGAGMEDYFLITQAVMDYAKEQGVVTGPGRGSGPGSRALYCLGVTEVEPISNNLLFERFLDPTRVGMPDVDLDFQSSKQDFMFDYAVATYGKERVARIGNNGVAWAKDALKKYGRVTDRSVLANELAALIPDGGPAEDRPLRLLLGLDPTPDGKDDVTCEPLIAKYENDDAARALLDDAMKIEGVSAAQGVHACGLVISSEPLTDLIPMRLDAKYHLPITEWDKNEVEEFGLVKFDFLAIDTLDVIADAVAFIESGTGEKIDTADLIPDLQRDTDRGRKAAEMIADGNTAGVFQLASAGMTELARNIRPETLSDYSALVALYRPGPMADKMHERYARRRRGIERINYEYWTRDKAEQGVLAELLDPTLATVVYQESVMSIAREIGGFDVGEVNVLRKAFSKKDAKKMASLRERFVTGGMGSTKADGTEKLAFKEATLREVWKTFEGSASYLFNACLVGDTQLWTGRGVGPKAEQWTIERLYFMLHGDDDAPEGLCWYCKERPSRPVARSCARCESWRFKFRDDRGFKILALDPTDGRIRPERVRDVHCNGVRPVFRMELSDGTFLRATGNHRWLTPDGYRTVDDLRPGDVLVGHGGYQPQESKPSDRLTRGERQGAPGRLYGRGPANMGWVDGGSVQLKEWTKATQGTAACDECGRTLADGRLERAHLDGDRSNNAEWNLAWKCPSHHKSYDYRVNGRPGRWSKGHTTRNVEVVTIVPDGDEMVYDVEMVAGSAHNFVANGVVSHNSHSCVYGLVGYWTAYLKANWPVHYGAALLANTEATKTKAAKRLSTIVDLKTQGIELLAPLINSASMSTSVSPDGAAVMLGLSEVAGVKSNAEWIIEEREQHGKFSSVQDFIERVRTPDKDGKLTATVSMSIVDALIEAGAFDEFGPRKGLLMSARADGDCPIPDVEWNPVERSARQRRRLGVALGTHPLQSVIGDLKRWREPGGRGARIIGLHNLEGRDGANAATAGVIASIEEHKGRWGTTVEFTLEGSRSAVKARCKKAVWDKVRIAPSTGPTRPIAVGDIVGVRASVRLRAVIGDDDVDAEQPHSEPTIELYCHDIFIDQLTLSEQRPALPDSFPRDIVRGPVREPVKVPPTKRASAPTKPSPRRELVTSGANALALEGTGPDLFGEDRPLASVTRLPVAALAQVSEEVTEPVRAKAAAGPITIQVNKPFSVCLDMSLLILTGDPEEAIRRWPELEGPGCAEWLRSPDMDKPFVTGPDRDGHRLTFGCSKDFSASPKRPFAE